MMYCIILKSQTYVSTLTHHIFLITRDLLIRFTHLSSSIAPFPSLHLKEARHHRQKEYYRMCEGNARVPLIYIQAKKASGQVSLGSYTSVTEGGKNRKYCFKIESDDAKQRVFYISAETEEEMKSWVYELSNALKVCIRLLLCLSSLLVRKHTTHWRTLCKLPQDQVLSVCIHHAYPLICGG